MTQTLKIDFVSDVSCPWCAIGLAALEQALARVQPDVAAELHFQPFELNPQMGPEGQDITEHLTQKYGSTAEQQAQIRETIRQRGAELGFTFRMDKRSRIYNTFDAHRLLHWAGGQGAAPQLALKRALLQAYHGEGRNVSDHDTLVAIVEAAGLDAAEARQVLATGRFAAEVRERERFYQQQGIRAVPAVIFNDRHLIQGGQPADVFEQALRQLSGMAA